MGNFNYKNIDFVRQSLVNKIGRPISVIAIYPQNSSDTKLLVLLVNNATVIAFRYISSSTVNKSISFVGKSVSQLVQEINQLGLPLKALQLGEISSLVQGDLVSLGSSYVEIPYGFTAHDRLSDNGVTIRAKKVSVRHKNNSSIKLLSPYFEDPSLPWYPRISNGSFSQKYNNKLYHFYINEFDNQSWSSSYGKPFKELKGISPTAIDKNTYQLPRFPVFWNGQNITVYNGDSPISELAIEDIDVNNGIIYTSSNLYLQEDFTLDYTYLETSYIYKDININGHFCQNPFVIDKYVVIYLLPAESTTAVNKKTVFHVIGNSIEEAINSIILDDPSLPIAIIGAYNIQQLFASDKVSILDTRTLGGGLKRPSGPKSVAFDIESPIESNQAPIEAYYDESYRFWDIGNIDGDTYPSSAAVIIDIPNDIKEVLSISDIKAKATKYLAAGVYPSIDFTERDLPAVSGLSAQVSCAYNLDLELTSSKLTGNYPLLNTISDNYEGAGWFLNKINIPKSILDPEFSTYNSGPKIVTSEGKKLLEVDTSTGVTISYLKSSSIAGIEWKERSISEIIGGNKIYNPWVKKKIIDTEDTEKGSLIKRVLSFDALNTVKQYKDFVIQSPFLTGDFKVNIKQSIKEITDNIFDLQTDNGQLSSWYTTVGDKEQVTSLSDYLLTPTQYNCLFPLLLTTLSGEYSSPINKIGNNILQSGCYTSGHYFKYYLQNSSGYVQIPDSQEYTIISYNNQLKNLNTYLYNRRSSWSGDTSSGLDCSTGLVNAMFNSSLFYGAFTPAIPTYWTYYPASGIYSSFISGVYISTPASLGGTITDISTEVNLDYLYNNSLPAVFSTAIAHTGHISDSKTRSNYISAYNTSYQSSIKNIDTIINNTRTLTGISIPTNWFIGHNRLGTFLGNALFNITSAYDYMSRHIKSTSYEYDSSQYSGANSSFLSTMFSGINRMLEYSYDAVFHNLLRGGIVEPDMALTLYGYGWYINNWKVNYGLDSSLYTSNNIDKYHKLFDAGLKQLIKNQFNADNQFIETTTINGNPGPFFSSTPYKILYPIAEALKIDSSWKGIAEGLVNTITNTYGVDGLYYEDPFKNSFGAGKEFDILGGLAAVYNSIDYEDNYSYWEPMSSGLTNLRGCQFLGYGVENKLDFWKKFNTGEVNNSITQLKSLGINTIKVDLDYSYWYYSGTEFKTKLQNLANICVNNKIRIIPTFIQDGGTLVTGANYLSFGATGGPYSYSGFNSPYFMTGAMSGESYVTDICNAIGNSPAVLGWNIVDSPLPYNTNLINYNSVAYVLDLNTNKPIFSSISYNKNSVVISGAVYSSDTYNTTLPHNNQRIDYLLVNPDPNFSYYIDNLPSYSKPIILNNYSNGQYADYENGLAFAKDSSLPYILSSLHVRSGSFDGFLYNDNEVRNIRQASALMSYSTLSTASLKQRKDFDNVYFYNSYYKPSYTSQNIIYELSNNLYEELLPNNLENFKFKIEKLLVIQSGMDTINHKFISNYYTSPSILTDQEANILNYYRTEWQNHNIIDNISNAWTITGSIDYTKYNTFVYDWGRALYSIANRIGLNG